MKPLTAEQKRDLQRLSLFLTQIAVEADELANQATRLSHKKGRLAFKEYGELFNIYEFCNTFGGDGIGSVVRRLFTSTHGKSPLAKKLSGVSNESRSRA
ncbi:hypothetical protein E6Q11_02415 [Candidatus Dojkabacteria bacterium]|uniref:Uncharacterized protein n=1 Tax=Candidatus Dojkabacteria bacterium TaxID=2099670 RepID=A0A5C7J9F6_9BACT|nr:MAG: hypothetical protein E6Q11_02415 [Candidatus Dojkabacteria bacterium]